MCLFEDLQDCVYNIFDYTNGLDNKCHFRGTKRLKIDSKCTTAFNSGDI